MGTEEWERYNNCRQGTRNTAMAAIALHPTLKIWHPFIEELIANNFYIEITRFKFTDHNGFSYVPQFGAPPEAMSPNMESH